jgi:hypothetical protein
LAVVAVVAPVVLEPEITAQQQQAWELVSEVEVVVVAVAR